MKESGIYYDDSELRGLYAELEPKERRKALKGAMRQAAGKVRRAMVDLVKGDLKSSNRRGMSRCVRALVYKRKALGFRVTVGEDRGRNKGFYQNRRGMLKPVLRWADTGTAERVTRGKGRKRGRMPAYGFVERTRMSQMDRVSMDIEQALVDQVRKVAERHGAKLM